MGGINIGRATIRGNVINIEGNVVVRADGTLDIPSIVRAVLTATNASTAVERLGQLDAIVREAGVPREQIESEAAKQLESSKPPRPVADAVAGVAQGAAGGVVSQGVFAALRAIFGF
jgi:hypothetical protein